MSTRRLDGLAGVSGGLGLAALLHLPFEGWTARCAVCSGLCFLLMLAAVVELWRDAYAAKGK